MNESRVIPPLRIAVLGDFEGIHTRRWLEVFVERGHEVHAISYYWPRVHLPGVNVHSLKPPPADTETGGFWTERPDGSPPPSTRKSAFAQLKTKLRGLVPQNIQRHLNAMRYRRAGLEENAVDAEVHEDGTLLGHAQLDGASEQRRIVA